MILVQLETLLWGVIESSFYLAGLKNDIPEWYYKNAWKTLIGAGHISQIISAWNGNYPYGHFYGEGSEIDWPEYKFQQMGDIKVAVEQWKNVVPTVGINNNAPRDIWWYNPIIFTPTDGGVKGENPSH